MVNGKSQQKRVMQLMVRERRREKKIVDLSNGNIFAGNVIVWLVSRRPISLASDILLRVSSI